MSNPEKLKMQKIVRRARRVRSRIVGTTERPRLCVHRSLRHITAQLIDDIKGVTLVTTHDHGKAVEALPGIDRARAVGREMAEKAKAAGIVKAVFDRGSYRYHGKVKALAEAAREAGLLI